MTSRKKTGTIASKSSFLVDSTSIIGMALYDSSAVPGFSSGQRWGLDFGER